MRLVVDKTGTDRIADACKNNRQSADFRLNNLRHQISIGDQHVRCQADQFHKDGACSTGIRAGKANINADIAALVPTQLLQFLPQRHDLSLCRRIGLGIPHEDADAPHPLSLLRPCRERPSCCRAAEQPDKVAASQVGHGGVLPPLCANEGQGWFAVIHGITERTAGPWATPEMF